ncbi:MAG: cellulase [Pseudomonadota bacterium]|jgi:endoglucanase
MSYTIRTGAILLTAAILLVTGLSTSPPANQGCLPEWPAFHDFRARFIAPSGKVIDYNHPLQHTTSEGQAYALFFSLIANDRQLFDEILAWTDTHLVQRGLAEELPAWEWANTGIRKNTVLDENSASDADIWLSYTLIEAGRIWHEPRFSRTGQALASHILNSEVSYISGLGLTLLPGRWGFVENATTWRLNPSYAPLPLMTYLALYAEDPRWSQVLESSKKLMTATLHGYASDWLLYTSAKGFSNDTQTGGRGSYDAIRVYLWAGMTSLHDPARAGLLASLGGMKAWLVQHDHPPESVDTLSGRTDNTGPPGFSAALLPFLESSGAAEAASRQRNRLQTIPPGEKPGYYDSALMLFGLGFDEKRFSFEFDGRLKTSWMTACPP